MAPIRILILSLAVWGIPALAQQSPFTSGPVTAANAPPPRPTVPPPTAAEVDRMWGLIRQGGLVLLMRHGKTDPTPPDNQSGITVGDCTTQRNLSVAGRDDSARLADAAKQRGMPIEAVLTSEFCRAQQTATGLVPLAKRGVVVWDRLNFVAGLSAATRAALSEPALISEVGAYLSAYRGAANLVVVTHTNITNPLLTPLGVETLQEGEFALLRPLGAGRFDYLGRLPPSTW